MYKNYVKTYEQFVSANFSKVNEDADVSQPTTPSTIWANSSMTIESYDENSKSGKFTFKSGEISIPVDMKQLDSNINGFKMFEAEVVRFATVLKNNYKTILDILDNANKPIANFNNVKLVFAMKDGTKTPLTTTDRMGIFGKIGGQASGVKFLTNSDGNVDKSNYKDDVAGYGFFYYQSSATYVNQPTPSFGKVSLTKATAIQIPKRFDGFVLDKTDLTDSAKSKIEEILGKIDKNTNLIVNTGASKDNDNVQHDFDLISARYDVIIKYLNNLGFKNVTATNKPVDANDTKNIYGKGYSSDLKDDRNRFLSIASK